MKWCGLELSHSEQGPVTGLCECGIEPLSVIKCGEFLECATLLTSQKGLTLELHDSDIP
jgi:hypothetical protein